MKILYEENSKNILIQSASEKILEDSILKLDPLQLPFIILESNDGNFIQCTGSVDRLVIEARFYFQNSFKHFVVGKREMSKVWETIHSKVGPILVLEHEVLSSEDAVKLFTNFLFNQEILENYNKRNITKNFLKKVN